MRFSSVSNIDFAQKIKSSFFYSSFTNNIIMKKTLFFALMVAVATACSSQSTKTEEHTHEATADSNKATVASSDSAQYQCPMKCEAEKTYTKAGKCPSCGMDLALVKK